MEVISRRVLEVRVANTFSLIMVWVITWFVQLCFVLMVLDSLWDRWLVKLAAYNVVFIQPVLTIVFFSLLGLGFIKVYDCEEVPIIRFVDKISIQDDSEE